MAVKNAFGEHSKKLAMSSTKSYTGHLLGVSGAVEAIICVKALQESYIPATINSKSQDALCDLDVVLGQGRKQALCTVMSNSLGFGGHNASIILRKYE